MPALYHDNHTVRPPRSVGGRLPPERRSRRPGHRVPRRSPGGRSRPAVLPLLLYRAPAIPHITRPRSGSTATGATSPRGGIGGARRPTPGNSSIGVIPPGTVLPPRPPWVPAWDDLDDQERALGERFMECFAAYLSYTDAQIGRLLAFLDDLGDADNTVVIVVSDNGASSEGGKEGTINEGRLTNFDAAGTREMYRRIDEIGGPLSHNNYPWGWTMAGNTPFRRWKREVHEGGVADPCIVSWPVGSPGARVASGGSSPMRSTCCRRCSSSSGVDRARRHRRRSPVPPRRHELRLPAGRRGGSGARQARHAVLRDARLPGDLSRRLEGRDLSTRSAHSTTTDSASTLPFEDDVWELYHVAEDVSETIDLAVAAPGDGWPR